MNEDSEPEPTDTKPTEKPTLFELRSKAKFVPELTPSHTDDCSRSMGSAFVADV